MGTNKEHGGTTVQTKNIKSANDHKSKLNFG
eukprot:Pgem_evm1s40